MPSSQRMMVFFDAPGFRLLGYVALLPLLFNQLGPASFGALSVTAALFGTLGIAQRGVELDTIRRVQAAHHTGDRGRLLALMSSAIATLGLAGLAGASVVGLLSFWLPHWLGVPAELSGACTAFLCIEALRFAIAMPMGAVDAGAQGLGRAHEVRATRGALTLAQLTTGLVVIVAGFGLIALGILSLLATLAAAVLSVRTLGGAIARLDVRPGRVDRTTMQELALASILGAAEAPAMLSVCDLAVLAVALISGVQAVALFAVCAAGCRLLSALAQGVPRALVPPDEAFGLPGQRLRARWAFRRTMDAALIAACGFGLLVAAFGTRILAHWLGVRGVPVSLMPAFGLLILSTAPVAVGASYLGRTGQKSRLAATAGLQMLATLLLSGVLVGPLGAPGAVLGMVLAQLATTGWRAPGMATQHLGIVAQRFWISRAWRLAAAMGPASIAALLFARVRPAHTTRDLILQTGVTIILNAVTAFAAWYLLDSRPELDID